MLRCPNPTCSGRKRDGYTKKGLYSHFRVHPGCERVFLSSQRPSLLPVPAPVVPQNIANDASSTVWPTDVGDNDSNDNDSVVAAEDDAGSLFPDEDQSLTCERSDHGTDTNREDVSHIGTLQGSSVARSDGFSFGSEFENNDSESDVGDDCDSEDEGNVDTDHDMMTQDNEGTTLPDLISFNLTPKPDNVYDFAKKNLLTPAEWVTQWVDWVKRAPDSEFHPCGLPDDTSLLDMLLEDPNYLPGWQFVSEAEKAEIRLMSRLCRIKNCPLFVYDHVRAWVKGCLRDTSNEESAANQIFDTMRSREQVLKSLSKLAHTRDMAPITQQIMLPGCGKNVDITALSYVGNLYYFLTDQDLANDNTLLLNGATPYDDPVVEEDYVIDDFNTGSRYIDAWTYKKEDPIDFPLGDIFFVDKSVYDCNDRLSCEPVMHTNSMVNCSTRNKSQAWMSLGYIPQNKSLGHTTYASKLADYHECLAHILGEYIDIQNNKAGLLWPLAYKGRMYMVRFRPYVLTVLGDTPGQNVMCGKMSMCNRLCRYCDVEKDSLSDPWAESEPMTVARQLKIQESSELREEFCYKEIDVFWNRADFGNDPLGIHGNVPGEILHAYMKGIVLRVHECIVASPRLSAKAQKKDNRSVREQAHEVNLAADHSTVHDVVPAAPKQEDLVKAGVFGGKMGKMVDAIAIVLGEQISQQSDKNICRTHFPQGLMTRSKTTASEQQGLTLLMSIILSSTWALQMGGLQNRLGDLRTGAYVKIMENLIMLEEVLKMHPGKGPNPLKKSDLNAIAMYTKSILQMITEELKRDTGDGFNLIKFHLLTHMIFEDILKYGLPRNISGCAGEGQFKDNFKLPGSTTQKRDYSFDNQVATRHHEHLTNRRCEQRLARIERLNMNVNNDAIIDDMPAHFGLSFPDDSSGTQNKTTPRTALSELMYRVGYMCPASVPSKKKVKDSIGVKCPQALAELKVDTAYVGSTYRSARASSLPCLDTADHCMVDSNMMPYGLSGIASLSSFNPSFSAINDFLSPVVESNPHLTIGLFTKLKVKKEQFQDKDILFRADPFCALGNKERHDWALIQWAEEDGQIPGMLLSFLDITEEMMVAFNTTICCGGTHGLPPLTQSGHYAVIQSLEREIPGLVDPTVTKLHKDDIMQMNSVLLFYGEKELDTNNEIKVRLVHVDSMIRPLIVVPDFDPTFTKGKTGTNIECWIRSAERQNSVIVLRPRDLWHLTFLELAKEHYVANNE